MARLAKAAAAAAGPAASSAIADSLLVYFVHPDLGIGGAERLIVDAAVGLQSLSGPQSPSQSPTTADHHRRTRAAAGAGAWRVHLVFLSITFR
jgi:hypothetical protein